jgi:hypothetical protein
MTTENQDLGERITFDFGRGDEAISTTREAIAVLAWLKERHSNRLYFDGAVASMTAADQSGTTAAIRVAVNDFKMFIYNTL